MDTEEWVVYSTTLSNGDRHLSCEPRADWDKWERRTNSGTESFPDFEKVELVAVGLTFELAWQMVELAER